MKGKSWPGIQEHGRIVNHWLIPRMAHLLTEDRIYVDFRPNNLSCQLNAITEIIRNAAMLPPGKTIAAVEPVAVICASM